MAARVERTVGEASGQEAVEARFEEENLDPHSWSNGPGYEYGWHSHGYHKVLYCVSGSVVFHTEEGNFELAPGDRLDVKPDTPHAATVGPDGARCMEAAS